jgi:predicted dehydrogenase
LVKSILIGKDINLMAKKVSVVLIGAGGMARSHIRQILQMPETTKIVAVCEVDQKQYDLSAKLFEENWLKPPRNQPDLNQLLREYPAELDAAFIITPHAYHHDQAIACMEAGLDVLLEKPMVMNASEARSLMSVRDRTGKLLVVAFPGSLSPQIRQAVTMNRSGKLGDLQSISATVWQSWGPGTAGTWRQDPEISGGGFMFDTGAHMLNTVVDLAGEEFIEVAAFMDFNQHPVETEAVVIGRLKSGAMVTLHGAGESIPSCASDVYAFYSEAILRTGIWGEKLEIQRKGKDKFRRVHVPKTRGVWEQFLAVREGKMDNPCPPEVGLRMAKLYDAIKLSAAQGGMIVKCEE